MENKLSQMRHFSDLYPFLARRVALYTGMDSSSVPKPLAQELFTSISFTLEQAPPGDYGDLDAEFGAGLAVIEQKIKYGKKLWRAVGETLPQIASLSLRSTVKSIGSGWKRYDYRYFAHQFHCDIDYQLCRPVPEELQGVDYINRYLGNLLLENDFLGRFDPQRAAGVLTAACGDYRGLLVNLYESVATNALGLALVGGDVATLNISAHQRAEIGELLSGQESLRLQAGAEKLAALLDIRAGAAQEYLRDLAATLAPRVRTADLEGIFLSWGDGADCGQ